jgi:hypothetical protein
MTGSDFNSWLKYHTTRFSGLVTWFGKFSDVSRGPLDPTKAEIAGAWEQILTGVDLADAKAATDQLASGEAEFSDRGFDCHPRDVRRLARSVKERRCPSTYTPLPPREYPRPGGDVGVIGLGAALQQLRDGTNLDDLNLGGHDDAVSCLLCRDSETIRIYDHVCTAAARRGEEINPRMIATAAAACTCKAGDRWTKATKRFNPRVHVRCDEITPNDRGAELCDGVAAQMAGQAFTGDF